MMYCSQWFTFKIPDAWWDAAGMRDFKTDRKVYRQSLQSSAAAEDATIIISARVRAAQLCLASSGIV